MKNTEHIRVLFQKYLGGECSREEVVQLMQYFGEESSPELLKTLIEEELHSDSKPEPELMASARTFSDRAGARLRRKINPRKNSTLRVMHKRLTRKWPAFAAVFLLLLLAGTAWIYLGRSVETRPDLVSGNKYGDDVSPGANQAVLTLASGEKIDLDSAKTGAITTLQGIKIVKKGTGLISYEPQKRDNRARETMYNTITTPKGGQYQLELPDGSRVWLNAASSLRYPARFDGKERMVELTGEAYFEVTHRQGQPFTVKSENQFVQVLGTTFNVNAYQNESTVNTTLVNGSIRVKEVNSGTTKILKPGQQALLSPESIEVAEVNINEYVAWKNGDFLFDETELHYILRQLERWYDIEVDYHNIPHLTLNAAISRDKKLSSVLYMIEQATGLVFTLEERRLSLST